MTKKVTAPKTAPAAKADKGMKWSEPRVALVKAMRTLGATIKQGRTTAEIATKAKVEEKVAKHYLYKDNALVAEGFVGIVKPEAGGPSLYFLTAKGLKANLEG